MSDLRMPDCRCVIIAGRLGHTPELKYTANGLAITKLSLATTCYRGQGKENDTLWLDVDCFGKTAETAGNFDKGTPVLVEGNLDVSRWTGKDGIEKSKVYIKANRVQRLDWDGNGGTTKSEVAEPVVEDDIPF